MLHIKNLNVFYDGLQALYDLSLEIQGEEFVCILGPNGAGKSTLLQAIAGMLVPGKGEISFKNRPMVCTNAYPCFSGRDYWEFKEAGNRRAKPIFKQLEAIIALNASLHS